MTARILVQGEEASGASPPRPQGYLARDEALRQKVPAPKGCPVKFIGEERRAARAWWPVPALRRARQASQGNPSGAGVFWRKASSRARDPWGRGGDAPLAFSLLALHQNPLRHDAST